MYQATNHMNVNIPNAASNIRQALNSEINRVVSNEQRKIDACNPIFMAPLYY